MKKIFVLAMLIAITSPVVIAQTHSTDSTSHYFEGIKNNAQEVLLFLQKMPKGGDLHNHHGGASTAENMLRYGKTDGLCLDPLTLAITTQTTCVTQNRLDHAFQDATLYNDIIDAWSMRNFQSLNQTNHDHFFATFLKYYPLVDSHSSDIIAEIVERAAHQNELYLELFMTAENNTISQLASQVGWNSSLSLMRTKLLQGGLTPLINTIIKTIDTNDARYKQKLGCASNQPSSGCRITVRYIYLAFREQTPVQVFAQLLAGFEVARKDPLILGINLVQPEDGMVSMRDYKLHMQMVAYLHSAYPKVHITLHAGELTSNLVTPDGLRSHISDAVSIAHAERIGHGVDVAYEDNADQLLKEMARRHVLVEINLGSNETILGIKGDNHPLPLYMRYDVPVALATDDEGVLRTNLTEQYKKAILAYHFSYPTLKMLVRNSIAYSFLPGETLWVDSHYQQINAACQKDILGTDHGTASCQAFIKANAKAAMQWELEKQFREFESSTY